MNNTAPIMNPSFTCLLQLSVAERQKANFKVRVTNPLRRKEYEMYVLRDDTRSAVSTPIDLRKELYKQFGAGLISCALDFLWCISRGIQRSLFV